MPARLVIFVLGELCLNPAQHLLYTDIIKPAAYHAEGFFCAVDALRKGRDIRVYC